MTSAYRLYDLYADMADLLYYSYVRRMKALSKQKRAALEDAE